ncbi:MAG: phosphoenolpyruvate carboxykinase (ATP) [Proteobacteria bacterium]|nr:phosphoenolpyruvate carboxykinase (ATP) [Pseudomonadota bacterium]MCP4919699.1 phosphoenolpyruvate carboxykinase (ATP) [Pseudomonadota bacterium]
MTTAAAKKVLHPFAAEYLTNPSQDVLRELSLEHTPAVSKTACGNLVKVARNKARQASRTFLIGNPDDAPNFSHTVVTAEVAAPFIAGQRAYIEEKNRLIEVQGWVGVGPRAVAVQWLYTVEGANIAGMQSILAFSRTEVEGADKAADPDSFDPSFRIVYTPDYRPEGANGGQIILVDLESYTTYIMGPDYFGESKKAALRMLNHKVFLAGGLVLHAGAKLVHVGGRDVSMTILGLSGTGKTTTTFSKQGEVTQPIQDDMVALWPNGEMSVTENGCFAKTWALTEKSEPVIYRGTVSSDAWVENVYTDADGNYDFFKTALSPAEVGRLRDVLIATNADPVNVDKYIAGDVTYDDVMDGKTPKDGWDFVKWTGNGRSIIPMSSVEDAADLHNIQSVEYMGILNRDEGVDACTPGIVKFEDPAQAAGFFMLGETTKTSAAGKERGKTRSPFTQPFFPLAHGLQASRFSELAATMEGVGLWLMNTGFVGGDGDSVKEGVGHKVKIRHSSAMLEALLTDSIVWKKDPDFGYLIVDTDHPDNAALVAKVPAEILEPRKLYAANGKLDVYDDWVATMRTGRAAFLKKWDVDQAIIDATCGA